MTQGQKPVENRISIRLFGVPLVERNGVPVTDLHLREGMRLLAYLTVFHGKDISYRTLAQHFWPAEARNAIDSGGDFPSTRQAIHYLRRALGPDADRLQRVSKGVVRLDLTNADVDIIAFSAPSVDPLNVEETLALYRGPLLDGWTDSWIIPHRNRFQKEYDRRKQNYREATGSPAESSLQQVPSLATALPLESESGAMLLDSRFYVVRPPDALFYQALTRQDAIIVLKGARQMGKTSLLARGMQHARETGHTVVITDLQSIPIDRLKTSETLYLTLATQISLQLGIGSPREQWDADLDPNLNLEYFLRNVITRFGSLTWGLDELDRLFSVPFGTEVCALFRSWYNRRALDPKGPWAHLSLTLACATEAHLFIEDLNQSPFNVGTRLALSDFTPEQVAELNRRYGSPLTTNEQHERFYAFLGGHPFLSRMAFNQMVGEGRSLDSLERYALDDDSPFAGHLRAINGSLQENPALEQALQSVLTRGVCDNSADFYRLRSAGIVAGDSRQRVRLRCRLYADFLRANSR